MNINPGWVEAAAAVGGVVITIAGAWVHNALQQRDDKIAAVEASSKAAQKLLFEKADRNASDLAAYKLHVAETYVSRDALAALEKAIEKALQPIIESIKELREELKEVRDR